MGASRFVAAAAVVCWPLGVALCVPPSVVLGGGESVHSEIKAVKNTLKILSEQWERWNTLFLTSLEPRITNTASTLASIDSNIHNLQERAHVWDTFQLHVSAWNEQLATLDRKMDILSKGQEKMVSVDNKINSILTMEYKLDNAIKQLMKIEDLISNIDFRVQNKGGKYSHDSLFEEFATRGILSSLKMLEKKLDRLLLSNQNIILKSRLINKDENSKLTIKCNTPKYVEDLLNDISSKVDVMFDSLSSNDSYEETEEEYFDVKTEGSGGEVTTAPSNIKSRPRMGKRALRLQKQNTKDLEEILSRVIRIENTSLVILDRENTNLEKMLAQHKTSQVCSTDFRQLYEHLYNYSIDHTKNMNLILESYFSEQRAHIATMFEELSKNCYKGKHENNVEAVTNDKFITTHFTEHSTEPTINVALNNFSNNQPITVEVTTEATAGIATIVSENYNVTELSNGTSCEDLELDNKSGIFLFESLVDGEETDLFFNKRYCEIRSDGLWTVIQRRDNYTFQENFNVSWDTYKYGFGSIGKDFWIGNDLLHKLTSKYHFLLRIELEDFNGNTAWAEYSRFKMFSEADNYKIIVSGYNGNASDSFSSHNGSLFSTYDRKNDEAPECCPCSVSYGGGWWFNKCFESNLNGVYHRKPNDNEYFRGIIWEHWLGNYSLKKTVMMVKSKGQVYSSTDVPFYEDP